MKSQNQVILSLGSNLGNRLENIQLAVDLIHLEVGTVIKIAPIYDTPAWGFESENFFNTAILIHTSKSAPKILSKINAIEQKLGRKKTLTDRKSTRLNSSHSIASRMPSSA